MSLTKYPSDKIIQILAEAELPGSFIAKVCKKYFIVCLKMGDLCLLKFTFTIISF